MSMLCIEEGKEPKTKGTRKKLKKKKSKTELDSSISEKSEASENEAGVVSFVLTCSKHYTMILIIGFYHVVLFIDDIKYLFYLL